MTQIHAHWYDILGQYKNENHSISYSVFAYSENEARCCFHARFNEAEIRTIVEVLCWDCMFPNSVEEN